MPRRNWGRIQPRHLDQAIRLSLEYAESRYRRNVDRVADRCDSKKWAVYGWVRDGSIPGRKIIPFHQATGADFVIRYLAHGCNRLLIEIPTGRRLVPTDITDLQQLLTDAVSGLMTHQLNASPANRIDAEDAITAAMSALAWHRENLARSTAPQLALETRGAAHE